MTEEITEWAIRADRTADSVADLEECDSQQDAYERLRKYYHGVPARVVYRTLSPWTDDR